MKRVRGLQALRQRRGANWRHSAASTARSVIGDRGNEQRLINDKLTEAISALTNLGYQPAQASHAIASAMKDLGEAAQTPALIRRGLKELAR